MSCFLPRIGGLLIGLCLGLVAEAEEIPDRAAAAESACRSSGDPVAGSTATLLLDALQEVNGVPGLGAAVWQDGRIVWTGCAGWRDAEARRPVQADTVFRLASVSKVYAATLAARLAEQGRLDLDAPVQQTLPWLAGRWAPLTVRQLAAHASGLDHYTAADRGLGARRFGDGRAAVRWFLERPLLAAPGTRYTYSSWGYTLMGATLEGATGAPFVELLQQELDVAVQADPAGAGDAVSRLYRIDGDTPERLPANDLSYTVPGGGLAATPTAVAEFAGQLMQGRFVSAATWAAMRVPYRLADGTPTGERDYQVGLGWRVGRDAAGAEIVHHAGITEGARSAVVLWPEEQVAVSLLSNAIWVSSIESSAMLLAAAFRLPSSDAPVRACPLGARRYQGTLGDTAIGGTLRVQQQAGRCRIDLAPDPALTAAFGKATAWRGGTLRILGLSATGELGAAALVTPYGSYALDAVAEGWQAQLPSGRLQLRMEAAR
ncbi:MAG: beta-lactamase family protein [Xanthomonadales bacterium]|jgi:CubicO group peptidase (beta-lactamase class C family)|nr:beta-lactamase family protein [Xanthomonadales bacterium]